MMNLIFFSPLEQFEISAYNTNLGYITTFPLELFEAKYFPEIFFQAPYNFLDLLLSLSILLLIQTNLKQKGFFFLFIFSYIILINLNIISFNDVLINNIIAEYNLDLFDQYSKYVLIVSNTFEYVTTTTSFINLYSVLFCFIFAYIIIYLIYNKMLSNNSNTLVPSFFQILGEVLYKVSLNLFYSILGKHVTIPELFIQVNTIFIFLIISNVQGMIPYMSTLTSALTNTFFIALALFMSLIATLWQKKGFNYILSLFMPAGCPIALSLLIIPIEVISYCFRLVSLSVRLFANMMAGHTLLKVIVGFSWVIVFLGNSFLINLFPIVILFILTLLEFGVALIQAYIFTVLTCIYLRDIFEGH